MLIIPVIDLSCGLVVHAKQGQRDSYQPITSVISTSADPRIVLSSFLELYPFKTIYIADLDAIQEKGSHRELISDLSSSYKECEFWVDAGVKTIQNNISGYSAKNIKLILGSENKLSEEKLSSLLMKNPDILLSLDFNESGLIENDYLLQEPSLWPERIIVMTLSRVGSSKGTDMKCLNNILELAKNKKVYAAGGVKNIDDLTQLKSTKTKGVLLATALHTGAITREDLNQFLSK